MLMTSPNNVLRNVHRLIKHMGLIILINVCRYALMESLLKMIQGCA